MSITSSETLDRINEMRARGEEFCVVTVVRTENATSAKAGAKALVTSDGEIHGFIGGGCVKGAVMQAAASARALVVMLEKVGGRNGTPRLTSGITILWCRFTRPSASRSTRASATRIPAR